MSGKIMNDGKKYFAIIYCRLLRFGKYALVKDPYRYAVQESDPPQRAGYNDVK